jgi:hypothetical protein
LPAARIMMESPCVDVKPGPDLDMICGKLDTAHQQGIDPVSSRVDCGNPTHNVRG